jgi:hypothetical protein
MTTKCSIDSAIRCLEGGRAPLAANEGSSLNRQTLSSVSSGRAGQQLVVLLEQQRADSADDGMVVRDNHRLGRVVRFRE